MANSVYVMNQIKEITLQFDICYSYPMFCETSLLFSSQLARSLSLSFLIRPFVLLRLETNNESERELNSHKSNMYHMFAKDLDVRAFVLNAALCSFCLVRSFSPCSQSILPNL